MQSEATFWDNPEKAQKQISAYKPISEMLKAYEEVERTLNDLKALEELCAEDPSLEAELSTETTKVIPLLEAFELRSMLSGSQDTSNAYVRVQAGAGGTEACDWAQMLVRMYTRWAETKGYKIELVDELRNESAGVRTATLYIIGDYAYGNLQSETGVHRLVRISPFDSNARRQTSFAAVDVTPEVNGDIDIVVKPDDLVRQTFC
jgi:peptide chain release factor 2